jgi:hypothetical protein
MYTKEKEKGGESGDKCRLMERRKDTHHTQALVYLLKHLFTSSSIYLLAQAPIYLKHLFT